MEEGGGHAGTPRPGPDWDGMEWLKTISSLDLSLRVQTFTILLLPAPL